MEGRYWGEAVNGGRYGGGDVLTILMVVYRR